jgi:hypothetical protein
MLAIRNEGIVLPVPKTLFDENCIAANKARTTFEESYISASITHHILIIINHPVGSARSPSAPYSEIKFLLPTLRGFSVY